MKVSLPDGAWVELLDPKKVTERKRRAYLSAMSEYRKSSAGLSTESQFGAEQQDLLDTAFDLLLVCLIGSWSFDQPVTPESFADLSTDQFDPIKAACLKMANDLLPDLGSPNPDPKATTTESPSSPTE